MEIIPDDLPGLEHQDTIVRQPSGLSEEGCFTSTIMGALAYFTQTNMPVV